MENYEDLCLKFLDNPKINPKTGGKLIYGKTPYLEYVELCRKQGYFIESSKNQSGNVNLHNLSLILKI